MTDFPQEPGVAIVTGGASGIGAGISRRLLEAGCQVVVADWNQEHLERFESAAGMGRDRLLAQHVDVSQPDQVAACVEACRAHFGAPTVLVNNAGLTFGSEGSVLDLTPEKWRYVLSINLDGAFYFSHYVARLMVQEEIAGRIVNIGSVNSLAAEKDSAAYCAAKGGLLLLTKAMAVDLGPYGILVNCIAPGSIQHEGNRGYFEAEPLRTSIEKSVPLGRPGTPAEIGETVAFLVSPRNTYLTGACLVVDGGLTSYLRGD